jgi:NADH:ubiquinone oxidoreductase subunit C
MTKLLFTKVLQGMPHVFLINKTFRTKGLSLLIPDKLLYFLALHIKLASPTRSSQLVEIFAYENPTAPAAILHNAAPSNPLLVYQFHNLFSQERLFVFSANFGGSAPKSLGELFSCSAWLEREAGEMHGICFEGKKDLRNLMLQYGDSSAPFRKSYPSIGTKEVFYDSVTDTLTQVSVSLQT